MVSVLSTNCANLCSVRAGWGLFWALLCPQHGNTRLGTDYVNKWGGGRVKEILSESDLLRGGEEEEKVMRR